MDLDEKDEAYLSCLIFIQICIDIAILSLW